MNFDIEHAKIFVNLECNAIKGMGDHVRRKRPGSIQADTVRNKIFATDSHYHQKLAELRILLPEIDRVIFILLIVK